MNWVVICDEVGALGWRLAGARAWVVDARQVAECFTQARLDADLLFITADLAARLPDSLLDAALHSERPLIAVIVSPAGGARPPDLEQVVKQALGIAA